MKLEKNVKIQTYHVSLLNYFLNKLKSSPDGQGSLLDHSLILYGSCMSNSNTHNHGPLPVIVAGGARGQLKGHRHIKTPDGTPMTNVLVAMLNKMDIQAEKVGDSNGSLSL